MAASHICLTCGIDLSLTRAVAEPIYGLPLVTCPECGAKAVRRRHPVVAHGRRATRAAGGILAIAARVVIALLLMILSLLVIFGTDEGLRGARLGWRDLPGQLMKPATERASRFDSWYQAEGVIVVAGWLAIALATGVFLAAAMPHWRRWRLWLAWTAILAGFASWLAWSSSIDLAIARAEGTMEKMPPAHVKSVEDAARADRRSWPGLCAAVGATSLVALGAAPLGRVIARAGESRRMKWRAKRRKVLRRRRMGQ